jgi:hypothetical protein
MHARIDGVRILQNFVAEKNLFLWKVNLRQPISPSKI